MGREILPHERELRTWLRRRLVAAADVEDVVQECYCRLAQLSDVSHITIPRAYEFKLRRLLYGKISRFGTFKILSTY